MVNKEKISYEIIELARKHGSLTLSQVEEHLDASFNLVFMAIDSLVSKGLLTLKRQGMEYILSTVP